MKKLLSTFVLALVALTTSAQGNNYTVSCDLTSVIESMTKQGVHIDSFYLADYASKEPISKKTALQENKIIDRLKELGCKEGDTVRLYGHRFDYYD